MIATIRDIDDKIAGTVPPSTMTDAASASPAAPPFVSREMQDCSVIGTNEASSLKEEGENSISSNSNWPGFENRPLRKVCEPDEKDVLFADVGTGSAIGTGVRDASFNSSTSSASDASRINSSSNCSATASLVLLPDPHVGNERFLDLVRSRRHEYLAASQSKSSPLERPMVALDILQQWRQQGGRFLKCDAKTRLWNDIGDKKARQRIAKILKQHCQQEEQQEEESIVTRTERTDNAASASAQSSPQQPPPPPRQQRPRQTHSATLNRARIIGGNSKLYGRSKQVETLHNIYRAVQERQQQQDRLVDFVLVSGEAGTGKTALVLQSLQPMVQADGGFMLQTKFPAPGLRSSQLDRDGLELVSSFATEALALLLDNFCTQLLASSFSVSGNNYDIVQHYRQAIQAALVGEEEVRIVTALVPSLHHVLMGTSTNDADENKNDRLRGSQRRRGSHRYTEITHTHTKTTSYNEYVASNTLEGASQGLQATKRVNLVIQDVLQAIASAMQHPLVVLFENVNSASKVALDAVVQSMVTNKADSGVGVLFVATCRCDTAGSITKSAVQGMVAKLEEEQTPSIHIHEMELSNLDETAVLHLLSDALLTERPTELERMAQVVYSITNGNVFFIHQLLQSLEEQELIHFDEESKQWKCDLHMMAHVSAMMESIDASEIKTTTVHGLFRTKICNLPLDGQVLLKYASCLLIDSSTSRLDPHMLQLAMGANDLSSLLDLATASGLLVLDADRSAQALVFAHSEIQEVAYGLIADDKKQSFHFKIGQKLFRKLDPEELDQHILVVARQLMLGDKLVTDPEEHAVLAALYLQAGETAVELSKFQTASVYLRHAVDLLGEQHWKDTYDLTRRLHNAAAEVFYCTAQFGDVEEMVDAILLNARSFEDTLHARATQIYALSSRNRQPEAIEVGLATLKELGEELPSFPSGAQLSFSMWRVKRLFRGLTDVAIMRLPVMKASRKVAAMQILNLLYLSALYSRPLLAAAISVRMAKLTVTYGKCAVSCVGFGFYSMLLCSGGSNIGEGYRFGKLAMALYREFENEAWLPRVSAAFYGCVCTWKDPVRETIEPLDHAYRIGLGTGDIEYAVLCSSMNCWNNSLCFPLPVLDCHIKSLAERIKFLGQSTAHYFLMPLWQMTQNFMGLSSGDPKELTGNVMNQSALTVEALQSCPGLIVWIRFDCMVLAYLLGDYDRAEDYSTTSHEIYDVSYGAMDASMVLFFECMTLLAQARRGNRGRVALVRRRLKRLRHWAKHSPLNFLGKQCLVEAELAVATGDNLSALAKYTSSIVLSREGGFLVQEALANERAGKYYLEQGNEVLALPFLRESYRLYESWGGEEKLRHLRQELRPLKICGTT